MSAALKTFLSMSFSGSLLILILLAGKRFLKNKISRQWQYYIWLIVILRLLLPVGPEVSLLGKPYQAVDQAMTQAAPLPQQSPLNAPGGTLTPADGLEDRETAHRPAEDFTAASSLPDPAALLIDSIGLIWLAAALGLLIRKATIYQGFIRYLRAGSAPVDDIEILDRLSAAAERAGVKKPVELCVNPLISSPLLIGFFRPCIVLPSAAVSETNFQYIVWHELTHYKRRDMFYKWLVQITVCLHWFNPLVHFMSREITKACEFSCDEAVLSKTGSDSAQDYGKTLLDAMAAVGKYRESLGAVTLSENKRLLKERLGAIMDFKRKSKGIQLLTAVLTLCVIIGTAFIGIYSAASSVPDSTASGKQRPVQPNPSPAAEGPSAMETLELNGTTYYLVFSEAQLRAIAAGEYGMDRNYMQQADIPLSAEEWIPIGTWDNPFTGTYNGNGFEIIGLTMTDPDAEIIGLFGVAENAHIYNITLRDYDILSAGRDVQGKSVGAILAIGQGSRSYDNFVYPKEADADRTYDQATGGPVSEIERYYEAGSLPLFELAFARLDETAQKTWLERIYADGDYAFFSVAVRGLDPNSSLLSDFAEKVYEEKEIAFFSTLADRMDEAELEFWLERALEDGNWAFQSMLYDRLNQREEFDALKEEQERAWAEAQAAEYRAVGITMDGKDYYCQGQLVNIFLDIRANQSFYTLNMNPAGTVNVKVIRNTEDEITGVAYMTETEVTQLLNDLNDPGDDWTEGREITIPIEIARVNEGEYVWLGTYELAKNDRIYYRVSAETGQRMAVGFAAPGQERPDPTYLTVSVSRENNDVLEIHSPAVVWLVPDGEYSLFVRAEGSALTNVAGYVTIVKPA